MLTLNQFPAPQSVRVGGGVSPEELRADIDKLAKAVDGLSNTINAFFTRLNGPGALNITQTAIQNCTIDDTPIGATTKAAGSFTTVLAETSANAVVGSFRSTSASQTNDVLQGYHSGGANNALYYLFRLYDTGPIVKFAVRGDGRVELYGPVSSIDNDGNFSLDVVSSNPRITLDSGDYIEYVRSTNTLALPGSVDINGGTIDGTVIGGASAAAGTFTNGSFTGTLGVTGVGTFNKHNRMGPTDLGFSAFAGLTLGNASETTFLTMGQDTTHMLVTKWTYSAEAGSASASIATYGYSNALALDASAITINTNSNGAVTFGSGAVTIPGALALTATASPTGTGTGAVGQIAWDTSYLYICTATNDWRRVALTDF